MRSMVGFRDPGTIGAKTRGGKGDGDIATEACVMKVLWWLKATQNSDGSWSKNHSGSRNALANTSFAILTYLAHGEYPGSDSPYEKDFGPVVQKAIQYVIGCVEETSSGVRMKGADGNEYAFLIATYALCEAYGMIKNPDIKEVALVCLDRIVKNQSSTGGWDYKLNKSSNRDDVSFAGWAIQALKAGKMAGLKPDGLDDCIKKAIHCLQKRNFNDGTFLYTAISNRKESNHAGLAGVGCLAMQLLGYGGQKEVASSLDYMREWKPTFEKGAITHKGKREGSNYCPQYYCYYATQCKYQAGMKEGAKKEDAQTWYDWNKAMKMLYTSTIKNLYEPVKDWTGRDHRQGYYVNEDNFSTRPYMDSCLVALQLMVYYRYCPNWAPNQEYKPAIDLNKKSAEEMEFKTFKKKRMAVAEFDLGSFMGFRFGDRLKIDADDKNEVLAARFRQMKYGGRLRDVKESMDRVSYFGELAKPFRKFNMVRLSGVKSGGLYKVEVFCPENSFTTEVSRMDELHSIVKMMEKKYSVVSFKEFGDRAYFENQNVTISVSFNDSGSGVIVVENKKMKARLIAEERASVRKREKVADDVGADML